MTDLYDIPKAERTREQIRAHYFETFPLLRAYEEIVKERNSVPEPDINVPADSPTAVDTITGAALALARIGRPARDRTDALHAERYIRALQEEMAMEMPSDPNESPLQELVIQGLYGLAGCLPTAEAWIEQEIAEADGDIAEIMLRVPDHSDELKALLREALSYGMPEILRAITARYGRHDSATTTENEEEGEGADVMAGRNVGVDDGPIADV